ncbi:MAG: hypothetical protein P8N69_08745 [Flavobacteriales bacterium]|nr:hypothetical protein [Flavobacteriales bacterium]
MKNFKYLFLLTVILSCASNFESISEEEVMIDSLKSELNSKDKVLKYLEFNKENNDSIVNQYALYIQKIKENIKEINKQELAINNSKKNLDFITKDTLDIINSIRILSSKLLENETMIAELNTAVSLEKSKNSEFAIKVSSLSVEIAKSNREVYFLREELSSMNASFEAIFNKYTLQNKKINKLNDKLNEVAYAIGTKSELLNNNVLTKSGGLIGIGKSRKLNSNMNTNYFTYSTKQDVNSIILGYKTIRVMTSHPSESYTFSDNNNDIIDSLVIIDKSLFWKNSKFLVLEVK